MTGAFADAPFSPCGLDARWKGARWFGGFGGSDGAVTSLQLAHGDDPWDEVSTQVRVEVRLPRRVVEDDEANVEIERAGLAREQVSSLWMATGTLDPEVRAAAFPIGAVQGDSMEPWADALEEGHVAGAAEDGSLMQLEDLPPAPARSEHQVAQGLLRHLERMP